MSRFNKYRTEDDRPPLRKLEAGESFTAKLIGDHDYDGDDGPVPVLELKDEHGEFAWIAGGWHARDVLADADPQHGDIVTVARLADRGRSHQWDIRVVQAAKAVNGDVPVDTAGLTEKGDDNEPLPF